MDQRKLLRKAVSIIKSLESRVRELEEERDSLVADLDTAMSLIATVDAKCEAHEQRQVQLNKKHENEIYHIKKVCDKQVSVVKLETKKAISESQEKRLGNAEGR